MRKILQDKICMNDINEICIMTQGKDYQSFYQVQYDLQHRQSS